ncbi:molybdenum cofactor guanylyltransferase [Halomarina litorea]|uniref:molybdenum cofactor guanylyltransferase n=1 Tax=Halomarina litorea TaxID=2961595 RepID=UPI0020C456FD|nr:molybdenum cofactor guanylyltransferase [Halomarina sp. BCD28]
MTAGSRAGIVLAGGYSTRFGEHDKALARLDDKPLLMHVIEGLAPAVDGVVVNCRWEQLSSFRPVLRTTSVDVDIAFAPDPVPDKGPVAGIAAGLRAVSTPYVAVVAADMPFVDAEFFDDLFDLAAGRDGSVPHIDGHVQPMHAVYRTAAARSAAGDVVECGDGSLHGVINRLDTTILSTSEVLSRTSRRTFTDVNSVDDFREVERKFQ